MKKLYILLLLPSFLIGQECLHQGERGGEHQANQSYVTTDNLMKSNATIPYQNSFENGIGDFSTVLNGAGTSNWIINSGHFVHDDDAADGGMSYLQHDDYNDGAQENWALSPTFDLSGTENAILTYWDHVHYAEYADCGNDVETGIGNGCQEVMFSTDYTDDVNSATWTVLFNETFDNYNANQSVPTNAWGDKTLNLPSSENVTIAFKYSGNFASDWLIDDIRVFDNSSIAADWDVEVVGTNATISISNLNNFDVGNDGHWHYSLDGGEYVAVMDTDDITLSGLSIGDHYVTTWLVDNDHNPLDPPVEQTINFSVFVVNAYPWCEGFENGDFGFGVEGWGSSIYSGTTEWATINANVNGTVTPLSGSQMVGFASGNYNGDTASIISPSMDLTGVNNPELTFNYSQAQWAGDQDQLRVFYRNAYDAEWIEIGTYLEDTPAWTQVTLSLPNPSNDYYIGFQATSGYGYGVTLDDICVDAALSINDVDNLDVIIYPNPVDGEFITISSPINGVKNIEIFDLNGRMVMNTTISGNTLDLSSFNSGFYLIKVTIDDQTKVSKLVIR